MLKRRKAGLAVLLLVLIVTSGRLVAAKAVSKVERDARRLIADWNAATTSREASSLNRMIDDYGLHNLIIFVDGRDPNVTLHITRGNVRSDLVVDKNGAGGSSLFMFMDCPNPKRVPVRTSQYLSGISFDIDWRTADEQTVRCSLDSIIRTCRIVNQTANTTDPQVFVLANHYFAYAISNTGDSQTSEVVGRWVIFERTETGFIIRAIIDLQ